MKQKLHLDNNDQLGTLTQDSMPRMTGAWAWINVNFICQYKEEAKTLPF